jgi:hypothetical protein
MDQATDSPLQDDRFLLLGALGQGGMASVFHAFDRIDQRMVALKVQNQAMDAGPAHPLSVEFDLWTRLRHPNIVLVHELAIADRGPFTPGAPYLVMEHVEGRPLHKALRPGRVEPAALERVAVDLLSGLEHVHEAGLVHRDLKPGNVLMPVNANGKGRLKLTDFGLASQSGCSEEPGRISGSLPYVSPEAILGLPLDGRADLYGLGILLYHLATGELPSQRTTADDLLRWHLNGPPADPRRLRPRFPSRLARFIRRLTARDPAGRPASAGDALELLGAVRRIEQLLPRAAVDRAERAKLRLALDASRLGARRIFTLPHRRSESRALIREVLVWSQVHGLRFFRLGTRADLLGLVLRLLVDRGHAARRLTLRYSLHRWLPLGLLSGLPLRDLARPDGSEDEEVSGAQEIARFILDCSSSSPLALRIEGDPADRLPAAVKEELRRVLDTPRPPRPDEGGLLLLLDQSCQAAR